MERWRPVSGYPLYEVSDHGNVRSKPKVVTYVTRSGVAKKRAFPGGLLTPTEDGQYLYVVLYEGEKAKEKIGVHRLVAQAFLRKAPLGKGSVMHLDDNGHNNRRGNLQWGSHQDNSDDKLSKSRQTRGSDQHLAKLTDADVLEIRRMLASGATGIAVANTFGISPSTVASIRNRKTWKHI